MQTTIAWSRWAAIPFAIFAVALAATFWSGRDNTLALFWLALAGALGYAALALALNATSVSIETGFLIVRHHPVPWPGRRVPTRVVERVEAVPRSSADTTTTTTWDLVATLEDGRSVRLTWGPMSGHAFHVIDRAAQTLSGTLGLRGR